MDGAEARLPYWLAWGSMPLAIAFRMYLRSAAELKMPGCVNSKPLHRATKGSLTEEVFEDAVFEDAVFEDAVFGEAVFGEAVFGEAVFGEAVFEDAVFEPGPVLEMSSLWHPALKLSMTTSARR